MFKQGHLCGCFFFFWCKLAVIRAGWYHSAGQNMKYTILPLCNIHLWQVMP